MSCESRLSSVDRTISISRCVRTSSLAIELHRSSGSGSVQPVATGEEERFSCASVRRSNASEQEEGETRADRDRRLEFRGMPRPAFDSQPRRRTGCSGIKGSSRHARTKISFRLRPKIKNGFWALHNNFVTRSAGVRAVAEVICCRTKSCERGGSSKR